MGVASQLTERLQALAGYSASYAYPPLLSLSRAAVQAVFHKIALGQLKVVDTDGTTTICGQQKLRQGSGSEQTVYSLPVTELRVHKDIFWVRMLLFADMVCFSALPLQVGADSPGLCGELHAR